MSCFCVNKGGGRGEKGGGEGGEEKTGRRQ
jgi:hypothetical protein